MLLQLYVYDNILMLKSQDDIILYCMVRVSVLSQKFATRLKFERVKRDYSQEKLAELAGIGRATLAQIEAKKSSPTLDIVEKIAKALDYEPYELFIFKNLEI